MSQSYRMIGIGVMLGLISSGLVGCAAKVRDPVTSTQIDMLLQEGELSSMVDETPANLPAAAPQPPAVSGAVSQALMSSDDLRRKIAMSEPRFDIHVNDVNAQSFFTGLVDGTSYNMVVHPGVTGSVTLNLSNVTVHEVLDVVRDIYGYEYSETRVGFEIQPIAMQTRMYPLDYLSMTRTGSSTLEIASGGITSQGSGGGGGGDANSSKVSTKTDQDIWKEVTDMLKSIVGDGEGRRVAVSPQSGVVIVRAMPDELRRVDDFLSRTQKTLNRQVILEAKVLEITLNDSYQQGINWGVIMSKYNMSQLGSKTISLDGVNSSTSVSKLGAAAGSVLPHGAGLPNISPVEAFGGMFAITANRGGFTSFIELLNQQGNVQVLSSPRVSTLNNQKAIIKIGTDEYFVTNVTSTTTPQTNGTSLTTNDVTFSPFFSGIALDVTPFIDVDDSVTLHVHPAIAEVTDGAKTVAGTSYPLAKSSLRESDSVVRAHTGQIIVIGGLMQHQTIEVNTSVPWLGDIPYVGNLFRQTGQQKTKQEIVILLRPTVVNSQSSWSQELHQTRANFKELDRGFHYGGNDAIFGHQAEKTGNH